MRHTNLIQFILVDWVKSVCLPKYKLLYFIPVFIYTFIKVKSK